MSLWLSAYCTAERGAGPPWDPGLLDFPPCGDPLIKVFKANYRLLSFCQPVQQRVSPLQPCGWETQERHFQVGVVIRNSVLIDFPPVLLGFALRTNASDAN